MAAALCAIALALGSDAAASTERVARPTTGVATSVFSSPAVRDLTAAERHVAGDHAAPPRVNPTPGRRGEGASLPPRRSATGSAEAPGRTPAPTLTVEGQGNGCGCLPPDTTGDVGPNDYVQLVNSTGVGIYNKTTGALKTPVFDLGALWPAIDTCRVGEGDPQVVYDSIADRWNLVQFDDVGNRLCWAVSQTADPTGTYFVFDFTVPEFPDYFKVGVWPTGYYVGTNEDTYTAYAFNRTKMLAGDGTANFVRFPGEDNFLMPADLVGSNQPSGGGLFYTFKDNGFHGGSDRIEVFELTPNFTTPASSAFGRINTIPISPFTYTVCGFFVLDCIPQPGTAENVDAVSEWPMQRLVFRKFADHEALVGNFTIRSHATTASTAGAGIRWFELRNTGAGWSLFQEGTQDLNDGVDRFMGSVSIDSAGDIALGYSASSNTLFPSIRYATRLAGDPLGTLQGEQTLQAGGGSQTSTSDRWGDYSAMAIDPSDGCTFWYTNEYYPVTATADWHTRVGKFTMPECLLPVVRISVAPGSLAFGDQIVGTTSGVQTVTVTSRGNANLPVASAALAGADPGDFAIQGDTCSGAIVTPGTTCAVGVAFRPGSTGPRSAVLRITDSASGSPHDVALSGTGAEPPNEFSFGKVKRNTKKGTAKLPVTVPGRGDLRLGGKGVKKAKKTAAGAGTVNFKIKATGNRKKKLERAGKVKVKAKVTYTPTGGTSNSKTKAVKLKLSR